MFSVFGENHKLSPISLNIKESEIRKWKRTEAVRKYYDKLFNTAHIILAFSILLLYDYFLL